MRHRRCKNCGDYHSTDGVCVPEYLVYHEDYLGDKPKSFRADSHYFAALKYAEYFNRGSERNLFDSEVHIWVERDGMKRIFTIWAEPSVHYHAIEEL